MNGFIYRYTFIIFLLCNAYISHVKSHPLKKAIKSLRHNQLLKAKNYIDQTFVKNNPKYWYYFGIIYGRFAQNSKLSKDSVGFFLDQSIAAYRKCMSLTKTNTQYHSFAAMKLEQLYLYYLNRGTSYYQREAYDRAIENYSLCHKIYKNDTTTHFYIAATAQQNKNYALAIENYQQCLQLGHYHPMLYYALSESIVQHLQDTTQALQLLFQATEKYPLNNVLLNAQHDLLKNRNKKNEILATYHQAIKKNPSDEKIYYKIAYLYELMEKPDSAIIYYTKMLALTPNLIEPNYQLACLYYNKAVQYTIDCKKMTKEEFQQKGTEIHQKINEYMRKAMPLFEKFSRKKTDLAVLYALQKIYRQLNIEEKIKIINRKIKKYTLYHGAE